jgi:glycosyltransferase involved in cell wall biosynthesis
MNVILIVDDYLPESTKIAAKMMHELALEFKRNSNEVLVVSPDSYNQRRDTQSYFQNLDGVNVFRFPSGKLKNISKPLRLLNEFLLPFRAWYYGRNHFCQKKIDLVVCYSPSIFWWWLVFKIKTIWKSNTYLILRDLFPQWAIDNGLIRKNTLLTKFFLLVEKLNYKQADTIGLMSENNLKWFNHYYKGSAKLEVLFNWATENTYVESLEDSSKNLPSYRSKLGLEGKIVYFYGGNIGSAQDMSQILRLAKNLSYYTEAHFLLVGAGDEFELIDRFIKSENLGNLTLLNSVSQDQFQRMLKEFDVGLFCLNRNHSTHNFPGKILGYLVHGLPVLGSVNPGNDLKMIIEDAYAGFVVESGDDVSFSKAAISLLNKDLRNQMSVNCQKLLSQKFSTQSAYARIVLSTQHESNAR